MCDQDRSQRQKNSSKDRLQYSSINNHKIGTLRQSIDGHWNSSFEEDFQIPQEVSEVLLF